MSAVRERIGYNNQAQVLDRLKGFNLIKEYSNYYLYGKFTRRRQIAIQRMFFKI